MCRKYYFSNHNIKAKAEFQSQKIPRGDSDLQKYKKKN